MEVDLFPSQPPFPAARVPHDDSFSEDKVSLMDRVVNSVDDLSQVGDQPEGQSPLDQDEVPATKDAPMALQVPMCRFGWGHGPDPRGDAPILSLEAVVKDPG